MKRTSRAAVLTAADTLEFRSFDVPEPGADAAILRVEACGLCGSDVEQLRGGTAPVAVPGHEPLGVIETIGPDAARRWGVAAGDRVCVEIVVPCHDCAACATGVFTSCEHSLGAYGYRPFDAPTPLQGGFAEYLYLHPNSIVHRIDRDIPARVAAMYNPIAAGIRWAVHLGDVGPGDTIAIFGAGQRGIAAAMAAKSAGAATVIITGLERDAHKLALATEFGADTTIVADREDVPARVRELTGGRGADVVLDLTPMAHEPVRDAIDCVRMGGTVVLAGLKGHRPVELVTDTIIGKGIRVVGARGVESRSIREAIALIESGAYPLERLQTHTYPLDEVAEAIAVLAGDVPAEHAVHVAILPHAAGSTVHTEETS